MMRWSWLARALSWSGFLLCCAALGCAHGQRPASQSGSRDPFGKFSGRLDAQRWLGTDAQRAKKAGAEETLVVAMEAAAAGDRVSGMLSVPRDACVLLIARASRSVDDLDLFAYGEDGTVLATDEAQDDTPSLLVCPPHPVHIYTVARVVAGYGLVAIGAQHVRAADAQRVGEAVGAHNRAGSMERRLADWPGLDERLMEHRRLIGSTWQDVRRVAVPLDPAVATRVSAAIDEDRCLDILVVPSEEVSYLDVSVTDFSGRIVGRAAASGAERWMIACAPARTAVTVEIRPHAGRGAAMVLLSRSEKGGLKDPDVETLRFDVAPSGDLSQVRKENATRLREAGYPEAKTVAQGNLETGRRSSINFDLPAGCSRLDLLGGAPTHGIEAWLWDSTQSLVAHDRGSGQVTLFSCGSGGSARLDVEALLRAGRYALELREERDSPNALLKNTLAAGRLLSRMVSRGVIRSAAQLGGVKVLSVSPTHFQMVDILVPMGRCVDSTIALGPGATGAELRLVDRESHQELALVRGTFSASARACALDLGRTLLVRAEFRSTAGQADALFATRMLSPKP
ncbi:MAG TPA: hypothetical protein VGJ84_20865 [Polyangiaceae bacterium]|jgi:hypothetical protein